MATSTKDKKDRLKGDKEIEMYEKYMAGRIGRDEAKEFFGDRFPEVEGARLMREDLEASEEEDFFLPEEDLSP